MIINDIQLTSRGESCELSAMVSDFTGRIAARKLWFRFQRRLKRNLTNLSDPFLVALLPLSMRIRESIIIEGVVSRRLLTGCEQVMRILNRWYPHLKIIDIKVDEVTEARFSSEQTGSFFTCGVDSFYTLLKNLDTESGNNRITHIIHVLGFDMSMANIDLYSALQVHLSDVANRLKLNVIIAKSNLRELTDECHLEWFLQQGAALAGVGLCLSPLLRRAHIAATADYVDNPRWGIHPNIDPLWSTDSIEFKHDGCESRRSQKVMRYIAESPIALDNLRGCWNKTKPHYNCGHCVKCLITMINLTCADKLEECRTFENGLNLEEIKRIKVNTDEIRFYLEDNLRSLKDLGKEPELQNAIQIALKSYPGFTMSLRKSARVVDEMLLNGSVRKWHKTLSWGLKSLVHPPPNKRRVR